MPRKSTGKNLVEQMTGDSKVLEAVEAESAAKRRQAKESVAISNDKKSGNVELKVVRTKFRDLIAEFKAAFIERDDVIDGVALAVLSANHVFMLGPPGTAKSLVLEEFSKALGGSRFRTLAMKYSTPEQFYGPLSLQALKEDRYERKTDNYLPQADFAFVDEIYKANAGVLNAALTIMVERMFEVNGKMVHVPLVTMMAASNETAQEAELAAMHDRFLVRLKVDRIAEPANKVRLITMPQFKTTTQLSLEDLKAAHQEIAGVALPEAVAALAVEIHDAVLAQGIPASDRRLRNAMDLVRAHAWLQGRSVATVADLAPLRFVFWDQPEQIAKVADIVMEKVNPLERKAREVLDNIMQALKSIEKKPENERAIEATEVLPRVNESLDELEAVLEEAKAAGHDLAPIQAVLDKATKMNDEVYNKFIGSKMRQRGKAN